MTPPPIKLPQYKTLRDRHTLEQLRMEMNPFAHGYSTVQQILNKYFGIIPCPFSQVCALKIKICAGLERVNLKTRRKLAP